MFETHTLVVRVYSGAPTVMDRNNSGTAIGKSTGHLGDNLNAAALQATSLAEYLRKMKPSAYDSYVMHTQYYSMVTVGQFSSPDDPALMAAQKQLAGMKLRAGDKGTVLDSLMPDPVVMQIPRPKR